MASYKTLSGYLIAICGNSKKIKLFKMYRLPAALLYKAGAANRRATFNARTNH